MSGPIVLFGIAVLNGAAYVAGGKAINLVLTVSCSLSASAMAFLVARRRGQE